MWNINRYVHVSTGRGEEMNNSTENVWPFKSSSWFMSLNRWILNAWNYRNQKIWFKSFAAPRRCLKIIFSFTVGWMFEPNEFDWLNALELKMIVHLLKWANFGRRLMLDRYSDDNFVRCISKIKAFDKFTV